MSSLDWRRERDSNPRNPFGFSGFQDHRHRPLGHLSVSAFIEPSVAGSVTVEPTWSRSGAPRLDRARLLCHEKCFDTIRMRATLAICRVEPASRADVTSFGQHAEENLQFIRRTMERSSTFTAVPGLGGAGMGVIGLAAAILAANQQLRRTMARRLAPGGGRRPDHRRHQRVAQGRPSRRAAGRRRRTPLRDEPGRAARRRGGADLGRLDAAATGP